jgi:hypothetical protein
LPESAGSPAQLRGVAHAVAKRASSRTRKEDVGKDRNGMAGSSQGAGSRAEISQGEDSCMVTKTERFGKRGTGCFLPIRARCLLEGRSNRRGPSRMFPFHTARDPPPKRLPSSCLPPLVRPTARRTTWAASGTEEAASPRIVGGARDVARRLKGSCRAPPPWRRSSTRITIDKQKSSLGFASLLQVPIGERQLTYAIRSHSWAERFPWKAG